MKPRNRKDFEYLDRALMIGPYHALCTTPEAFQKELSKLNVPLEDRPPFLGKNGHATTHSFINDSRGPIYIVCIYRTKKKTKWQICALLCHEAVHIWQHFRDDIGESKPGAEQEAYAIQNIAQSLMEAYFA